MQGDGWSLLSSHKLGPAYPLPPRVKPVRVLYWHRRKKSRALEGTREVVCECRVKEGDGRARNRAREAAFLGPAAFHHPFPLMLSHGSPLLRSNMGLQGCEAHPAHPCSGAMWGCRGVRLRDLRLWKEAVSSFTSASPLTLGSSPVK